MAASPTVESVFKLVKISCTSAICERRNKESGNGVRRIGEMAVGMQGTRLRIRRIEVEMQGIIVRMWRMQGIRVGIWEIGVGMQGTRLEMRRNWGKNKGV